MKTEKQTKWGWGLVALAGLLAATTIDGSLLITAASTAIFALGAWRGGYMDKGLRDCETRDCETGTLAGERRAA